MFSQRHRLLLQIHSTLMPIFRVGVIPDRTKPFTAYNLGGLLRFSIEGAANVAQVKILARGQEPLAGDATSQIKFNNDGSISSAPIQFVPNKNTCVLTYTPASGTFGREYRLFLWCFQLVNLLQDLRLRSS